MSFVPNAPWTPSEKVDLLVNVLRSAIPDLPSFLVQVLNEKGIYPKWNDTPLPAGRSLASSQIVYEEMIRLFKQQGTYNVQPLNTANVPQIAPAIPPRRPFPEYDSYAAQHQQQQHQQQQQRTLQPRPPRSTDSPIPAVTNGEGSSVIRPVSLPEPTHETHRKKRGRPSKEEAEERDRVLAAEGKVYQPKKRPAKKPRPSLETPSNVRVADASPMIAQTTPTQTPELREEGSSGKRKSKRHPRDDSGPPENPVPAQTDSPQPEARSPSDRLLAPHRERDLDMLLTKPLPIPPSESENKEEKKEQ